MTTFPGLIDTFLNPSAATTMDAVGFEHDVQHTHLNDAVLALQTKVGADGSADQSSMDWKLAQLGGMFMVPNSNFRFQSGLIQIWDTGLGKYVTLVCNNGVLGTAI